MKLDGMHHLTMITGDAVKNGDERNLTSLTNPRAATRQEA